MTKKKFDEFVAKQSSETKESEIDWSKKQDEWLEYLKKFYKKLNPISKNIYQESKLGLLMAAKKYQRNILERMKLAQQLFILAKIRSGSIQ